MLTGEIKSQAYALGSTPRLQSERGKDLPDRGARRLSKKIGPLTSMVADVDGCARGAGSPVFPFCAVGRTARVLPPVFSVSFVLVDERGNSSAIGAKITIHLDGTRNLTQRKEIKLSGGFLSFDNPVIHFGVGEQTMIDRVSVRWPDGEESVVDGPLNASGIYRIVRLQ